MRPVPESFYKWAFCLLAPLFIGVMVGSWMPNRNVVTVDQLNARDQEMSAQFTKANADLSEQLAANSTAVTTPTHEVDQLIGSFEEQERLSGSKK